MPNSLFSRIIFILALTIFISTVSSNLLFPVYASSCENESLNISRTCPQKDSMINYLMTIKKGGTNVLSTADYDKNFFLCEEYTFDCGYVEDDSESVSVANGIQLSFTHAEIDAILPANPALASTIKRYLNLTAAQAKCGMKVFPLTLTSAQSDLFFTNYMNLLVTDIKNRYTSQKMNKTKSWAELNINIKTAVLQVIKQDKLAMENVFWDDFRWNNFTQMSDYLKKKYESTNQLYYLRSAYLIDSVTQRCNKHQSISFLIDESGSIGNANFQLAKDFLKKYVENTFDDPKLMSVHFYDTTFEPYLDFGKSKEQILNAVTAKTLRGGGTITGDSINKTIDKILKANFDKGMSKILVVMTDGKSYDNVLDASNYARSKGITMIAVGIGSAIFEPQLLQIAQIQSNLIKVASYADLDKLVSFIENYFCKQIINVKVNETIIGNVVRVPESPAYFRLDRSLRNETFQLRISYESDPDNHGQVMYRSEYDPFPDEFTEYKLSQSYRLSLLERVYFVEPVQQEVVRIKKNYQKVQSFINSYVSVAGNDLKFNISLSPCISTGCIAEKSSYQSYGSKKNDSPIADKQYNIYGILAGSIAALACLSLIGLIALKKMTAEQEEQEEGLNNETVDDKFRPQITEQDIDDEDSRSSHSRRSRKSSHERSSKISVDDTELRKSGRSTSAKKPLKNPRKVGGKK